MKLHFMGANFSPKSVEFVDRILLESKDYENGKINNYCPKEADVLVCLGGDGAMLHHLHSHFHYAKPFYGINYGNLGFLLNKKKKSYKELIQSINDAKIFKLHHLHLDIETNEGKKYHKIAFNEVSLLRNQGSAVNIQISIDNKIRMEKLSGDGIIVATPLGSNAYNKSCGGITIPFENHSFIITPINPLFPSNWKGTIVNDNITIKLTNIDEKRSLDLFADFSKIANISSVIIRKSMDTYASLLFDEHNTLIDKINKSQFNQ